MEAALSRDRLKLSMTGTTGHEQIRIGIDASNLREGGGVTHLVELLRAAKPDMHGIERVVIWAGRKTLEHVPARPWMDLIYEPLLDDSWVKRIYWQHVIASRLRQKQCDLLFSPGGTYLGTFRPFVTMSRNMLPFEYPELRRYGFSSMFVKLLLLRRAQAVSFLKADGLIFLSGYAKTVIERASGGSLRSTVTIPHGVDGRFQSVSRPHRLISSCSPEDPFRILYVSNVAPYKHQWQVVEAVVALKRSGHSVALDLIGSAHPASLRRLRKVLEENDSEGSFIRYLGAVSYAEMPGHYLGADAFVYASSCENLPNILLEAMASGLPIACSNRGPMPEVLGDAGVYFDPERPEGISMALKTLLEDTGLRERHARSARERARLYTWERCARDTFDFLAAVARGSNLQREVPKG
jgi:glycosyltransferase involved in cell wall biosynthesis